MPRGCAETPRPRPRRRLLLLALLAAVLPLAHPADAASGGRALPRADASPSGGVSVEPEPGGAHLSGSRHALDLRAVKAGAAVTDAVVVRTTATDPVTVDVYPADGEAARNGGIGFALRGQPARAFGAWATLTPTRVTVVAGHPARVALRVAVPASAAGGRYVGGVVAEPPPSSGSGVRSVYRFGMAVYLEVQARPRTPARPAAPTAAPPRVVPVSIAIARHGGSACVRATYRNEGGTPADPDLAVTTAPRLLGRTRHDLAPGLGAVPPGATVTGREVCHRLPAAGARVTARLAGPGVTADAPATSRVLGDLPVVVDLALLLLLLLLLLLAALAARALRHRRARRGAEAAPPAG